MREEITELWERDWLYSLVITPGLGRRRLRDMYNERGSFQEVAEHFFDITGQITREQVVLDKQARLRNGVEFVSFLDEEYPEMLGEIPDPPLLLFYRGDLALLKQPCIGVVGSRKPTAYGRAACGFLVKQLVDAGFVIVSGLAYGIDGEAHRTALRQGGGTVAVLGCGIDQVYPSSHRALYREISSSGLVLSEYPPGIPPVPGLFPERNRIVSGLSCGVLIVEAAEQSGSLITADCALEQGREVFAVPGPIFSEVSAGPHNLIKQGAKLVTSSADIVAECTHLVLPAAPVASDNRLDGIEPEEKRLFERLTYEAAHWDELYASVGPADRPTLNRSLLRLEAKGLVCSLPGGYYSRK
ncbi:DNA-processing protein DprA [Brevibacillus sp. H7]|uniref:DNA-processing protein DprA n=1 Tax=Brevibacillus sp. H7 TaxID=3349138 RepID=UPI003807E426